MEVEKYNFLNTLYVFRRDGIPATSKMLEKAIRILFESNDVSQVGGVNWVYSTVITDRLTVTVLNL